jgi:hypothetical protein
VPVSDMIYRRRVQKRPKKPKCEDYEACGQTLEEDELPEMRSDCWVIDMGLGEWFGG